MFMQTTEPYSLRAKYVFPIEQPPIDGGCITVAHGKIVAVGRQPQAACRDLGDVAILPSLINAHTHLEFSGLEQPLGQPGMIFPDWIREVIKWRIESQSHQAGDDDYPTSVRRGIAECHRTGTTTIGDITTRADAITDGTYHDMQGVAFFELLGLAPDRQEELRAAARGVSKTVLPGLLGAMDGPGEPPYFSGGLSPHAPYTASLDLVDYASTLSQTTETPIAMHLAETREELKLLQTGGGPFRELLDELGAWPPNVIQPNTKPLDYLQRLVKSQRSLVIHGNYLADDELDFIATYKDRMSVVYCPRTHAYFSHAPYPLTKLIERGINVAIGTDSRASNPDLNMLSELRFLSQCHPTIAPDTILRMATSNAAVALGMPSSVGMLTPGKQANFAVLPISPDRHSDPEQLILASDLQVQQVYRCGFQVI